MGVSYLNHYDIARLVDCWTVPDRGWGSRMGRAVSMALGYRMAVFRRSLWVALPRKRRRRLWSSTHCMVWCRKPETGGSSHGAGPNVDGLVSAKSKLPRALIFYTKMGSSGHADAGGLFVCIR